MSTGNAGNAGNNGLLQGKVALVTGASRGIGRRIAEQFAAEGALVAVHFGRSEQEAEAVVRGITEAGGSAFAVQADMGSLESIRALFATLDRELTARTGEARFDILVNNAAIATYSDVLETTEAQFDELFAINVKGVFFTLQQSLPRLRDNGRIINVSSLVTRTTFPNVAVYAATKGALDTLTLHLAPLVGERGITINSLAPGAIDTDMSTWIRSEEGAAMATEMASIKRVGKPDDIAGAALLLASAHSGWITANYIEASGGAKL